MDMLKLGVRYNVCKICVERLEFLDWVSYSDDDCLVARFRVTGYMIAGVSEELAHSSILP